MIRIRQGKVVKIINQQPDISEILVLVDDLEQKAVNYCQLTGPVQVGDLVVLNTTAVHQKLGTGGQHFVIANWNVTATNPPDAGHIIKLRYTPGQLKVLAVEEEASPAAEMMRKTVSLDGLPVIAATLHSMLPPVVLALHALGKGQWRVAYIMTDGAALPLAYSKTVRLLKQKNLIHATITCGHAFGGDYEAVNIYSALLAAKAVAKADIVVVSSGPGIVGTGTKYGYTALEQGQVVNAVHTLGGRAVAAARISFADRRQRHRGLSHHTGTALGNVALARCTLALPELPVEQRTLIEQQLKTSGITAKHHLEWVDAAPALQVLLASGIKVTTMGRSPEQDRPFFLAAAAAGVVAAGLLS